MQIAQTDLIILIFLAAFMFVGFIRGVIKEGLALAVLIMAIWTAVNFSNLLLPRLSHFLKDAVYAKQAAFLATWGAAMVAGTFVLFFVGLLLPAFDKNATSRLLGAGLGGARAALLLVMAAVALGNSPLLKEGKLAPRLIVLAHYLESK